MIGVILLNMGGPDSLEAVKPFLLNLFTDRDIIRLGPSFLQGIIAKIIVSKKLKKSIHNYSLIGGKSPLIAITNAQAKALEAFLNAQGLKEDVKVYVGMRYWHPFIQDTVKQMYADKVSLAIALTLYPQYSIATTGTSMKVFETSAQSYGLTYSKIDSWYADEGYINALVQKIMSALKQFSKPPVLLFSAHSLPQKFIDQGDPYEMQTRGTIQAVMSKIQPQIRLESRLAYQSKTGPVKWLEPTTEDMLQRLAKEGAKDVLIVPISFVSDHIETLFEIDTLYKELAAKLGINLQRTESLNTDSDFIKALGKLVLSQIQHHV